MNIAAGSAPRLADANFFAEFPAPLLETLEQAATLRRFKKNTHIIVSGEECHAAYLLVSGTAYAFTDDDDGNEFIISSFTSGACFGELGLLDNKQRTANVMTTSDCECLVIPKTEIMRGISADPAAALAVIRALVGQIRSMTDDVSCLALMDVYGRLARVIQNESKTNADGVKMTERMTHQELANRVGSSREMVSKILKDLRVGGYIRIDNHRIVLDKALPDRW